MKSGLDFSLKKEKSHIKEEQHATDYSPVVKSGHV